MSAIQYRHTWSFGRDNRIIRFYLWAWKGDADEITFCKLFWGLVFGLPNLLLRLVWLVLTPLRWMLRPLGRAMAAEAERAKEEAAKPKEPEVPKPDTPGRIAEFFARPRPRLIAKIIGFALLIPLGLAVAGGLVFALVWLIPNIPAGFAALADWFAHTDAWKVAAYLGSWAVIFGGYALLDHWFHFEERSKARKQRKREAGDPLLSEVLIEGAKAVKTNTCPRIEIRAAFPESKQESETDGTG